MLGLGTSRRDQASTPDDQPTPSETRVGRKKRDGLFAIFQESVVETAIEEFKQNTEFTTTRDGETLFVAAVFDTENIGGLGKKSKKDEDKGQFIEEVSSGRIRTYMPEDFINREQMIIIPDAQTLSAMDEFTMLTDAPYTLCTVHTDGTVDVTDHELDFTTMRSVAEGSTTVNAMLTSLGETWAAPEDDTADSQETKDEADQTDEQPASSDASTANPASNHAAGLDLDEDAEATTTVNPDVYKPVASDEKPAPAAPADKQDTPADANTTPDKADDKTEEESVNQAVDDDTEFTDEQVHTAITRRFYSDDLGLEVSTAPFDAEFLHGNPYIPFDENRGEGWLNQYLNQMSKDANIEMRRAHQQHLFEMRKLYYDLISKHSETVQRELDINDADTKYGMMFAKINEALAQAKEQVDGRVAKRRAEIEDDWNKKLAKAGEDGKRAAEQQYRDRHERQRDEAIYRLESEVVGQIHAEYDTAVRNMHGLRRNDASRRMDYGIVETLNEVSNAYKRRLASETKLCKEWRTRMDEFLDNHRKDEVAHDQALAEELAQRSKADKVLEEYTAKLNKQTEEFEAKKQAMKAEIEAMDRKTAALLRDKQAACDTSIAAMQQHLDEQKQQIAELLDKYASLDAEKEHQYAARLSEARDEKDAWSDKCSHIIAMHKKTNIISAVLVVVACVATLAIGTLIGSNLNLDFGSTHASEQVVNEFHSRMDKLDHQRSRLDQKLNEHQADSRTGDHSNDRSSDHASDHSNSGEHTSGSTGSSTTNESR